MKLWLIKGADSIYEKWIAVIRAKSREDAIDLFLAEQSGMGFDYDIGQCFELEVDGEYDIIAFMDCS